MALVYGNDHRDRYPGRVWASGAQPRHTYTGCLPARGLGMGLTGSFCLGRDLWGDGITHASFELSSLVKSFREKRAGFLDQLPATLIGGNASQLEWIIPGRTPLEISPGFFNYWPITSGRVNPGR